MSERLGPYELLEELGRGGMGRVYRARTRAPERTVALKVLDHDDPATAARFEREAEAAARVHHPHLVGVHAAGRLDGQRFIAMELIEGESLSQRIKANPPSPEQSARWIESIAHALAALHAADLLHRDVKPSNVLIDGADHAYLTDFGVALDLRKTREDRLSLTGELLGTPCYMAPEQAEALGEVDARTDVYGLGATLYHLLTGRPPFVGPTIRVLTQVAEAPPEDPRALRPELDPALSALCLRALAKRPEERFPSAAAFADALAAWRAGEAAPPRFGLRPLAIAAGVALLSVVAGLTALWARPPVGPPPSSGAGADATPAAEPAPETTDWADLVERLALEGARLDAPEFEARLSRLRRAPDPAALRGAKLRGLEAGAAAWGDALATDPSDPRLHRLRALLTQAPAVHAGPQLTAALDAGFQRMLQRVKTSHDQEVLHAVARFEDTLFYDLSPRPRWSLVLQGLLGRLVVDPARAPRVALVQLRYWLRPRKLTPTRNDWLQRALAGRPRSALRAAQALLGELAEARRPSLGQLERAAAIAQQRDLLPDLSPRHVAFLCVPFVAGLPRLARRLEGPDRQRAGDHAQALGLAAARALATNPYLILGGELRMAVDLAASGARMARGVESALETHRRALALVEARLQAPLRGPNEQLRFASRIDKDVRINRARLLCRIAETLDELGRKQDALTELSKTHETILRLPTLELAWIRGLEANLLLDLGDLELAATRLTAERSPAMLRNVQFARAAIRAALLARDRVRARTLRRQALRRLTPRDRRALLADPDLDPERPLPPRRTTDPGPHRRKKGG